MNSKASREQGDHELVRRGTVSWLTHPPGGRARIEAQSLAFHALPVSMPEGDPIPHEATPGELLAITHAMFLAGFLSEALVLAGTPASEIVVEAACTFVGRPHDRELTAVDIQALGRVAGLEAVMFREAVAAARRKSMRSIGVREDFPGALQAELQSSG
jgi:hypothetical protein